MIRQFLINKKIAVGITKTNACIIVDGVETCGCGVKIQQVVVRNRKQIRLLLPSSLLLEENKIK